MSRRTLVAQAQTGHEQRVCMWRVRHVHVPHVACACGECGMCVQSCVYRELAVLAVLLLELAQLREQLRLRVAVDVLGAAQSHKLPKLPHRQTSHLRWQLHLVLLVLLLLLP